MKKIYLLTVLLLSVCMFSACSNDDDDDNYSEIVGKWEMTKDYYMDKNGKVTDEDKYESGEDVYEFKSNGKAINTYKDGDTVYNDEYTYTFSKNILTITAEEDGKKFIETYSVEFSGNKMIIKTVEADEDGGYYVAEYKKI